MTKLIGGLIGVVLGVLGELIAAIIEKQTFFDQLASIQGLVILVVLVLLGLILATLLEKRDKSSTSPASTDGINVSGLNAKRSSVTLKGPRINLKDSKLVDSPQDYNTLDK